MRGLVFLGDKKTEVRDFPIPTPGPNDVRIRIKASAICGSDRHMYKAPHELLASGKFGATGAGSPQYRFGAVSGHEGAGFIDAVGENVEGLKVGDRVTIHHHQGCGHCTHCLSGEPMLCGDRRCSGHGLPGTNAEYTLIAAKCCVKLPEEISTEVGAFLGCQGITAYSALRKLEISGNTPLVVYGLGPLGMIASLMAKRMGATVTGIDISDYRLRFAREKGLVDFTLNPGKDDCEAWLKQFTKGIGVKKGLVACGAPQMLWLSSVAASVKGLIILIGVAEGALDPTMDASFSFDGRHVIRKELTIRGSYVMPMGMFEDLFSFLTEKKVDLGVLTTHHFRIEDGDEAFALFDQGETGKVVFNF